MAVVSHVLLSTRHRKVAGDGAKDWAGHRGSGQQDETHTFDPLDYARSGIGYTKIRIL
jgi:hypothetical protein